MSNRITFSSLPLLARILIQHMLETYVVSSIFEHVCARGGIGSGQK